MAGELGLGLQLPQPSLTPAPPAPLPLAAPPCRTFPEHTEMNDEVSMDSYVPVLQPLTVLRTIIPKDDKASIVKPLSSVHVTF
jgi:hypothetical protein